MKAFGIAGHSGMGKTTLLERLVPELLRRGLRVSLVKQSGKDIEVDRPGKDSWRLRDAGCHEVLLVGRGRWALMHELRQQEEPPLAYLLSRLQACDIVLVEGYKESRLPKLEVWRSALGRDPLATRLDMLGVAAPREDHFALRGRHPQCSRLPLEDVEAVADFVVAHAEAVTGSVPTRPEGHGYAPTARIG
jgi:molybdopterin-guanine dinucleotide biosynthesis adapter protein